MIDINQSQLSLFRGVHDTQPRPVTLMELVTMMRTDQSVRDLTDKHRYARTVGDEQGAKRYKHMMASFGVAARFEGGRQQKHIVEYTGLSLVDIDHIPAERMSEVLALVHGDEHTLLAYVTLSGQGLRVLARYTLGVKECSSDAPLRSVDNTTEHHSINAVNISDYKKQRKDNCLHSSTPSLLHSLKSSYPLAFAAINEYYQNLTGLPTDGQCKNIGRISTIAYDENLYYNPDATPFTVTIEEKKPVGRPKKGKSDQPDGNTLNPKLSTLDQKLIAKVVAKVEADGVRYEEGTYNKYVCSACYEMNRHGYVQCRVGNLRGWNVVPLTGDDIHNNHCLNAHRSRPDSEE